MTEEPSKLKKDQRRESILNSAIKVMSEKGYEATTMREIAKEEGISETLLYRFFKNKQEVLFGIMKSRMMATMKSFEEFVETTKVIIPDPAQTLPLMQKLMKSKLDENRELITLFSKERHKMREYFQEMRKGAKAAGIPPFGKMIMEKMSGLQFEEALIEYFDRCKEAGNLKKELNTKSITRIFLNLIFIPIPFMPIFRPMKPIPNDDEINDLFETQMQIFLHGIMPEK